MESQVVERLSNNEIEQVLLRGEATIATIRAAQMTLIGELDLRQVDTADGCRSMNEWVASRLDVSGETAAELVVLARRLADQPGVAGGLAAGEVSFDRAVAASRVGDDDPHLEHDISGIRRLGARRRRYDAAEERDGFRDQYVAIQPTLGGDGGRFHGRLAGVAFATFDKAVSERGDEYGTLPDGTRLSPTERNAHGLVAMAQDSLDRTSDAEGGFGSQVTILVDATEPRRRYRAEVEYGPRVGPEALAAALCTGSIQVVGVADGRPATTSDSTRAIPPAVRRYIALRDGGCCADGCTSRYRRQPHHVRPRSRGGSHHPDNIRTLCWFHHHVVVHGYGFTIDPRPPPDEPASSHHPEDGHRPDRGNPR